VRIVAIDIIVQRFPVLVHRPFFGLIPASTMTRRQERGYAILLAMDPQFWSVWKEQLRRGRLTEPVLILLEGVGAFRSVIAQLMLAVSPFTGSAAESWMSFAQMLEDPKSTRAFIEHLREEGA